MQKTVEELKQKAEKALKDPKLVEIAKTAPNLTRAHDQAFQYVFEQTKDLQKAKELAVSTRWLTMLRRDYEEEFEKLVSPASQSKPEAKSVETKKQFCEIAFQLPSSELITRHEHDAFGDDIRHFIRFSPVRDFVYGLHNNYERSRKIAREFCMQILNALLETADPPGDVALMNDLIQFLEEKFRLKVRVCGNCKNREHLSGDHCDLRTFVDGRYKGVYITLKDGGVYDVYHIEKRGVYDQYQCPHWILEITEVKG